MKIKKIKGNLLANSVLGVIICNLFSKFLGLIREVILAAKFGTSMYSDVYLSAFSAFNVIALGFSVAIACCYIPVMSQALTLNKETGDKFSCNITTFLLLIGGIVSFFLAIFSEPYIHLLAIGFDKDTVKYTVKLFRIMDYALLSMIFLFCLSAFLELKRSFFIASIGNGVLVNIFLIMGLLLSRKTTLYISAVFLVLGYGVAALFCFFAARKKGYVYHFYFNYKAEDLKKALWLIGPVFIGELFLQINGMIDYSMSTLLDRGFVSALNYASKINSLIVTVFASALSTVMYPKLSTMFAQNNLKKAGEEIIYTLNLCSFIVIPCMFFVFLQSGNIVEILYQRGNFDTTSLKATSECLLFYSLGIPALSYSAILNRVYYAFSDTKSPLYFSFFTLLSNFMLNLLLISKLAHKGLALATSLSMTLVTCYMLHKLKRKTKVLSFQLFKNEMLKIVCCALLSSGVLLLWQFTKTIYLGRILELIISFLIFSISFLVFSCLLKIKALQTIINKLYIK